MATTTNYGWTTPDDTALVKDGASAIRSLGSSVDTTVKALNPETTLGDIAYRSSTANTKTRLGIGTTGQVLTVSGGVPAWATPASGGGMTLISTTTLSGSSVSLNSIANTYKHLLVVITDAYGSNDSNLKIQFNSDTTATRYRWTQIQGSNGTLTQNADYEDPQILVGASIIGGNAASNDNMNGVFWVYNYTATLDRVVWGRFSGITAGQARLVETDGLYTGNSAAISSIQLSPTAGTWSGGSVNLWGVA